MKIKDTLLAFPHLFAIDPKKQHPSAGKCYFVTFVYALNKANVASTPSEGQSPANAGNSDANHTCEAAAFSAEHDAIKTSAAAATLTMHHSIQCDQEKDDKKQSYAIERYLNEIHKYLHANSHTSKTTGIKLAQLCAVRSIAKLKPSINFKAADAIKSRPQTFGILWGRPADQPQIYALVPYNASASVSERLAPVVGEGVVNPGVSSTDFDDRAPQTQQRSEATQSSRPPANIDFSGGDMYTVYVTVPSQASLDDIKDFFSQAGEVAHVWNLQTHSSRNTCSTHVVMCRSDCVPKALALNGRIFLGRPCVAERGLRMGLAASSNCSSDEEVGDKRARDS